MTKYVYTLDPHDSEEPIKKFPDREYLKEILDIWDKEKLILIEKSRQMMMTWLCCALSLHEAQFNEGKYVFAQSKKEDDANVLLDRIKFIYHRQPDFLKQKTIETYCKLKFTNINSQIVGIPQGGDQIRMHTASRIFSDEMAFQPEAEDAFSAAKPCIDGGGAFVGVSTANPGFFAELTQEQGEAKKLIIKGLHKRRTNTGFCVITLHYTADPEKTTPEWKKEAKKGFIHEDKWKKEYEIDYEALGGTKVYPEIEEFRKTNYIPPRPIPDFWTRYAGIDPGTRNPTSVHLYAIDTLGNVYVYFEIYEKELHYADLARTLKEHPDFKRFHKNIFIDPITATKVHHTKLGIKSFKEILEQEGIYTNPGNRDRLAGAEKIREYISSKRLYIFKNCPEMIKELDGLRYEEWKGESLSHKNIKEEIVPKNDHAWSEMRYVLMSEPMKPKKPVIGIEAKIKKLKKEKVGAFADFYRI